MQPETSWTQIQDAAAGDTEGQANFVRRYSPVLSAYFNKRWHNTGLAQEIQNAMQEVFVDCFREAGVLAKADQQRQSGFRRFLFGVARVTAQRIERQIGRNRARQTMDADIDSAPSDDRSLSRAFDRAWALQVVREAVRRNEQRAEEKGAEACLRVKLLQLRFVEGLPIREIAPRLGIDIVRAHREYAKARAEYHKVLLEVVAEERDGTLDEVEGECADLLTLLD